MNLVGKTNFSNNNQLVIYCSLISGASLENKQETWVFT